MEVHNHYRCSNSGEGGGERLLVIFGPHPCIRSRYSNRAVSYLKKYTVVKAEIYDANKDNESICTSTLKNQEFSSRVGTIVAR